MGRVEVTLFVRELVVRVLMLDDKGELEEDYIYRCSDIKVDHKNRKIICYDEGEIAVQEFDSIKYIVNQN